MVLHRKSTCHAVFMSISRLEHLLRRLAVHYPDDVIAGILNRQGRKTANGERFTANQVGSLRRYRNIPRYEPPAEPPAGQVVPIRQAAQTLLLFIAGSMMVSSLENR